MKFRPLICTLLAIASSTAIANNVSVFLPEPLPNPSYEPPTPGTSAARRNAPDMGDYIAIPPPPKSLHQKILERIYISGIIGMGFSAIKDVENTSTITGGGIVLTPPFTDDGSLNQLMGGAAIGFKFWDSGLLSRIELEYTRRNSRYKTTPLFQGADPSTGNLVSKVATNLFLLKPYWDLPMWHGFQGYFMGGIGIANNRSRTNATLNILGGSTSNITTSKTSLAGALGLGLRYHFTPKFIMGVGYEFDYLGKNLQFQFTNPAPGVMQGQFTSGRYYSNTLTANITFGL